MKIAYFDCFSGISGDMTVGALLDSGARLSHLKRELAKLKTTGYALSSSRVRRGAIAGTKFDVQFHTKSAEGRSVHGIDPERSHSSARERLASRSHAHTHAFHAHRPLSSILRLIDRSSLAPRVKTRATEIFERIGKAEAKVHGLRSSDSVELHELGSLDSIIDIVGACIAIDELAIDAVYASPITLGRATIKTAHGLLPVPAPATIELLRGVPTKMTDIASELVTPTGAGIVSALAKGFGPLPPSRVIKVGYGAGTRELSGGLPNMLRVVLAEVDGSSGGDRAVVIEANIDDMNPQFFEHVFERLFEAGALDVFIENIIMKKSRPAFKLSIITTPAKREACAAAIFETTTTIGVRTYEVDRIKLERKKVAVSTRYGKLYVKISTGAGGIRTVSPEYDDCLRAAKRCNVPLRVVYNEAMMAASRSLRAELRFGVL